MSSLYHASTKGRPGDRDSRDGSTAGPNPVWLPTDSAGKLSSDSRMTSQRKDRRLNIASDIP